MCYIISICLIIRYLFVGDTNILIAAGLFAVAGIEEVKYSTTKSFVTNFAKGLSKVNRNKKQE